jgi:uncharacterized membrane protein
MSPDEPVLTLEDRPNRKNLQQVRVECTISLIAGIWLFVSPWVYGSEHNLNSWNSWLIGGLIITCMWLRLAFPSSMPGLSWFAACLGVYLFVSPWLYGYISNTGRWVNSMCVGIAIALSSICAAAATKGTLEQSPTARQL